MRDSVAFQIGDGARHFQNAVVGARGEALLLHGALQQALGVGAEFAVGANLPGVHLRVGVDFFAVLFRSAGAGARARP